MMEDLSIELFLKLIFETRFNFDSGTAGNSVALDSHVFLKTNMKQ